MSVRWPLVLERLRERGRVVASLLRPQVARLRGARIGHRVRFGPRVRIDRPWTVTIGECSELEADVWIKVVADEAEVKVGAHVFLGRGVELDVSRSVAIGAHALVAPGVFITDHAHRLVSRRRIAAEGCEAEPVTVGEGTWLGARAVVLPGVRVGQGAVLGAGAVVSRGVPDWTIAAGTPARVLRRRDDERE